MENLVSVHRRAILKAALAVLALGELPLTSSCATSPGSAPANSLPATQTVVEPTSTTSAAKETATPPEATPSETTPSKEKYSTHTVTATIFWVGEKPSADNNWIDNRKTEWDDDPVGNFGGVDDPNKRNAEGLPIFTPKENPFYIALPASEFTDNGLVPNAREDSPWKDEIGSLQDGESLFKGRWVNIQRGERTVYAQWLDTGPSDDKHGTYDYQYVFGGSNAKPANTFGEHAGIDVSPTAAFYLGFLDGGVAKVSWSFVDAEAVPPGLWRQYEAIDNKTYWTG